MLDSLLKKIPELIKRLTIPYQIGFVQGHSHLSEKQVLHIKQVLNSNDSEEIVNEYEQRMTSLIGSGFGISFAAGFSHSIVHSYLSLIISNKEHFHKDEDK